MSGKVAALSIKAVRRMPVIHKARPCQTGAVCWTAARSASHLGCAESADRPPVQESMSCCTHGKCSQSRNKETALVKDQLKAAAPSCSTANLSEAVQYDNSKLLSSKLRGFSYLAAEERQRCPRPPHFGLCALLHRKRQLQMTSKESRGKDEVHGQANSVSRSPDSCQGKEKRVGRQQGEACTHCRRRA